MYLPLTNVYDDVKSVHTIIQSNIINMQAKMAEKKRIAETKELLMCMQQCQERITYVKSRLDVTTAMLSTTTSSVTINALDKSSKGSSTNSATNDLVYKRQCYMKYKQK